MTLTPEDRRVIANRAARYLREQDAFWTQRYWLCDLDAMEREEMDGVEVESDKDTEYAIGQTATIGRIREWLSEHNFTARNRRCGVCAEGALLLAMAENEIIPDDAEGVDLLAEFTADAKLAATDLGIVNWPGIALWNDDRAGGEDEVIVLLDRIERINQ